MPFILGASSAADTVHSISQSIRFNDGDSAFMKRDYSGDGSQTTFTLSGWFKLGDLSGTAHCLFATGFINGSAADFTLYFSGDQLYLYAGYNGGTPANKLETTQLFRDHSAWYHIVFTADTTHPVDEERIRMYVNGVRVTAFDGTPSYPSQNDTLVWGDATYSHVIGATGDDSAGSLNSQTPRYHYDGYMAELVYLDGTATTCNSFAELNSSGLWIPKSVSGLTFGTNGFHIDGSDATGTPVKLGDDVAGSNNYTTSGMEANDQRADTPTNNQITFNPLNNQRSGGTPKNGNLEYHGPGTRTLISLTAAIPSTGKWVVAMTANSMSTAVWNFGVNLITNTNYGDAAGSNEDLGRPLGLHQYPYSGWFTNYFENSSSGTQISPSPSVTPTTSDEFWCAIDMATGKVFMGIYDADDSGSGIKWLAQDGGLDGNPTTGDNPTYTFSDFINNKDVTFGFASKNSSTTVTLLREADCTGTTPTDYTYFENVKDLIGS